ncbi:NYN domain-containing protein [bacterium]|jgi:uncharacterized LabA/DUF88 family protein|nr:NYN domain-containing protein [bacterium]
MEKIILLIDGGYLRQISKIKGKIYNPDYIEKCAKKIMEEDEKNLLRVLYYDCSPFEGSTTLPISRKPKKFLTSNWLEELGQKDLFAIRRGKLKFRGYTLKRESAGKTELTDDDFEPSFEQKGVDMRIGLDIASYSHNRLVAKIILVTNDTDCVPTLKYARRNGISVSLVEFEDYHLSPELLLHTDKKILKTLP